MKARFDELLPFYVNGTLSEADRAWVEDYLREHPKSRAELQWYESLQGKLREDVPPVSSEVGMERALARIHREGPQPARPRRAAAARDSLWDRLRETLASIVPQPVLRPAFAGALVVVAVQAAVIASLVGNREDDDPTQMRSVPPSVAEADKGPLLKLNLKPDAREADIRLLIVQMNGSLAGGPGQLGDWYVRLPAKSDAEQVAQRLKAEAIVESVAVVDGLPARP